MFIFLVKGIHFPCMPGNAKICISPCGMLLQYLYVQKDFSTSIPSSSYFHPWTSKHLQGTTSLTFFSPVLSTRKTVAQAGKGPIQLFKRLSWKHDSHLSKMDALPTFPQGRKWSGGFSRCPLSPHHMDSVGIWQINLVKVALASQPHPSAQTFSPQWSFIDCREIS